MFFRWKRTDTRPTSLQRRLRLETLDERAVPDGSPGDPPETPPPQAGDPAAQATQQVWAWVVYADGTASLDQATVPLSDPSNLAAYANSIYDAATGTIISADANFAGQTTLIEPPSSPQANTVYFYNAASGTWTSSGVSSDGSLLAPAAGYSVIPISSADGQGVAWAVQPQSVYLPASALAATAEAAADSSNNPAPPGGQPAPAAPVPQPPPLDPSKPHYYLPGPVIIRVPGPNGGPSTTYTFPGGVYITPGPNGGMQLTPNGQPGTFNGPSGSGPIPLPTPGQPPFQINPTPGSIYRIPGYEPTPLPSLPQPLPYPLNPTPRPRPPATPTTPNPQSGPLAPSAPTTPVVPRRNPSFKFGRLGPYDQMDL